jgi:FkbM family methyltransferase
MSDLTRLRSAVGAVRKAISPLLGHPFRADIKHILSGSGKQVFRQYVFAAAGRLTPTVEGNYGGLRYLVRTSDVGIGRGMFDGSGFEVDEMNRAIDLLSQHLGPHFLKDRTFVDVGANIGNASLPAVAIWGAARAIAVEPEPENYRLLRCNAIMNGMEEAIVAVQAAVTNSPGVVSLELASWNSGDHRVRTTDEPGLMGEEGRPVIEVQARRLDDLLAAEKVPAADVGLLWIDVQGHEGQVLDSAPSLLAQGVPVMAEFWPYGHRRSGSLDLLRQLVIQNFEHIIDVRRGDRMRTDQFDSLVQRYDFYTDYTDLIFLPNS